MFSYNLISCQVIYFWRHGLIPKYFGHLAHSHDPKTRKSSRTRMQTTIQDRLAVLSIIAIYSQIYYFVESVLIAPLMTNDDKITPL